ncbi:uncharacterized protein LOC133476892 isoform X1 [Phyllopteryx taeniolatus]|uniref:uncharacterized protein LOC133476892 isoform X1 n=2 Tax=Phyllopteryx taeniolatus TaxID=161469 RepID=UPI002AD4E1BA|nr:uncharacterized protein LOC133476892 isoform X1 [Phyllopteryx taeniolatus]
MYACCVLGCTNSRSIAGKLKFYRLPTAYRPFQANRRCLWLEVLQKVNGSAEELKENARICGAHFISGRPSMDQDNPDFVPSVFTNVKNSPRPKNPSRRIFEGRRKHHWGHRKNDKSEGTPTEDVALSVQQRSMETAESEPSQEMQTTACAMAEETKRDTEMKETPSTPFDKTPSPLVTVGKISPVVLLKHIVAPSGAYMCELCNESFSTVGQLVQHKYQHERQRSPSDEGQDKIPVCVFAEREEPSFPCNICDRTFTDRHSLKRHKLLHVKDGRKCQRCGVLFCRLHKRTLLVAQPVPTSVSSDSGECDEVCPVVESQYVLEPGEVVEHVEDFDTSWKFIPLLKYSICKVSEAQAPASDTELEIVPETPPPPLSLPICPEANPFENAAPKPQKVDNSESLPRHCLYPHPKLPPALRMFSHQCLTSAFFEVQRNYEYIFSKGTDVPGESVVKKEPPDTVTALPPDVPNDEPQVKEPTAFDMQIVL